MSLLGIRSSGLSDRGGAGLACDQHGVALGPTQLVVSTRGEGGPRWEVAPIDLIERAVGLAYGPQPKGVIAALQSGLQRIAKRLEDQDTATAIMEAVLLRLPPIDPEALEKLAGDANLTRTTDAWQSEPRLAIGQTGGGQWTADGAGHAATNDPPAQSASTRPKQVAADKPAFVSAYLAAARKAADSLGVPPENLLGLAALESTWATSRFAKDGNNLLGMYYPVPYAIGSLPAHGNAKARLARFSSVEDCFRSFAEKYKAGLEGVRDPVEFATVLQQRYKFGIDTTSGQNKPAYVTSLARTIEGLKPIVQRASPTPAKR